MKRDIYIKRNGPFCWNSSPQFQFLGLITGLAVWLDFFLWHFFPSFPYHHHLLIDNPEKIVKMSPPEFASMIYCPPDICVCSKRGTNVWLKIMTQSENDCDKNVIDILKIIARGFRTINYFHLKTVNWSGLCPCPWTALAVGVSGRFPAASSCISVSKGL